MSDPLEALLPPEPTQPLLVMAEAYRIIAADTWLEMPNETRVRLLDMADLIERREVAP